MAEKGKGKKGRSPWLYIGVGLVLLAGAGTGGYFLYLHLQDKKEGQTTPVIVDNTNTTPYVPPYNGGNGGGGTNTTVNCNPPSKYTKLIQFPMLKGQDSSNVVKLQQALNKVGAGLTSDGKFGCKTEQALAKYSLQYFPGLATYIPGGLTSVKSQKVLDLIIKIADNKAGSNPLLASGLSLSDLV